MCEKEEYRMPQVWPVSGPSQSVMGLLGHIRPSRSYFGHDCEYHIKGSDKRQKEKET